MVKKLTSDDVLNCIKLYESGWSCKKIANLYDMYASSIYSSLIRHGVVIRSYSVAGRHHYCDENFFDSIYDEKTSYFFGLLYADGCNIENRHDIVISLNEEDRHILELFSSFVQPTKILTIKKYSDKKHNWKNQVSMRIVSDHMSKTLNDYGLVPRKTTIKKFPDIIKNNDENIVRHFIRGYFDGNGSIYTGSNNRSFVFAIYSTYDMCDNIGKLFKKYLNIDYKITGYKREHTTSKCLRICKRMDVFNICNWLYKDSTLFIIRKYNRYELYKKYYNELIPRRISEQFNKKIL